MNKRTQQPKSKGTVMEQKVDTEKQEPTPSVGDTQPTVTEGEVETTGETIPPEEPTQSEETEDDSLESSEVGLEETEEPKVEEDEVQHYVDPIDSYSSFARSIRDFMKLYTETMSPTYPVVPSEMLAKQEALSRNLTRIFKNPSVVEFQEAMDVVAKFIKANPETFTPRYINRGMDNVALSKDARKQFETVMFVLPLAFTHPEGRQHYLNYGTQLSKLFPEDASGEVATRLQAWMKRYLSIE